MTKHEPAYGIIDPDYARVFTIARCIALSEGYALTMHGSFTRDLDLLAVPWTEQATEPEHLVRRVVGNLDDLNLLIKDPKAQSQSTQKPHGRLAWTLTFKAFGDPRFVDLSVMPRAAVSAPENGPAGLADANSLESATLSRDEALEALRVERERVRVLGEALAPFAKEADRYEPDEGDDDDKLWVGNSGLRIKHLRSARSVLAQGGERG